jgi:hypothetical protein
MTDSADTAVASPLARISPVALNVLMKTLEVRVVRLSECLMAPGWRLELQAPMAPAIHYSLGGGGRVVFKGTPPIGVRPHTLVIVPSEWDFALEADAAAGKRPIVHTQNSRAAGEFGPGVRRTYSAQMTPWSSSVDISRLHIVQRSTCSRDLSSPIVEHFDEGGQLDLALRAALDELLRQEVGGGAMAVALMKQVMVTLLRRSLTSSETWVERFVILSDPPVAKAFSARWHRNRLVALDAAANAIRKFETVTGLRVARRKGLAQPFLDARPRTTDSWVLRPVKGRSMTRSVRSACHVIEYPLCRRPGTRSGRLSFRHGAECARRHPLCGCGRARNGEC